MFLEPPRILVISKKEIKSYQEKKKLLEGEETSLPDFLIIEKEE